MVIIYICSKQRCNLKCYKELCTGFISWHTFIDITAKKSSEPEGGCPSILANSPKYRCKAPSLTHTLQMQGRDASEPRIWPTFQLTTALWLHLDSCHLLYSMHHTMLYVQKYNIVHMTFNIVSNIAHMILYLQCYVWYWTNCILYYMFVWILATYYIVCHLLYCMSRHTIL